MPQKKNINKEYKLLAIGNLLLAKPCCYHLTLTLIGAFLASRQKLAANSQQLVLIKERRIK